jgi:hypothetical protein
MLSTVKQHEGHARRKKEVMIVISVPPSDLGVGTMLFSRTTVEASLGLDHGATLKSSSVSHGPVGLSFGEDRPLSPVGAKIPSNWVEILPYTRRLTWTCQFPDRSVVCRRRKGAFKAGPVIFCLYLQVHPRSDHPSYFCVLPGLRCSPQSLTVYPSPLCPCPSDSRSIPVSSRLHVSTTTHFLFSVLKLQVDCPFARIYPTIACGPQLSQSSPDFASVVAMSESSYSKYLHIRP